MFRCDDRGVSFGIALWIVVLLSAPACGQPVLNPATYRSPSGQYELFVDPATIGGAGPAEYRFSGDGEVIWSGERPFALWDARVLDDGVVVGFAYSAGYMGSLASNGGKIVVQMIERGGSIRMEDRRDRYHSNYSTTPPSPMQPLVDGLLVLPQLDRLILRIGPDLDREEEMWWCYELSGGRHLQDLKPDQPDTVALGFHRVLTIERIPGTPLHAALWYLFTIHKSDEDSTVQHDARISVLTADGVEVWRDDLAHEYDGAGEAWNWSDYNDSSPFDQVVVSKQSLTVRSHARQERASYRVRADVAAQSGWVVENIRTVKEALSGPVRARTQPLDIPLERIQQLEPLGTITLNPVSGEDPIPGAQPEDDEPVVIARTLVGADGQFYVVGRSTGTLHVLDRSGKQLRVNETLVDPAHDRRLLGVSTQGGVCYRDDWNSATVEHADGTTISRRLERGSVREWLFQVGPEGRRWSLDHDSIRLANAAGKETLVITRAADGTWIESVTDGAMAPDGSLAILTTPRGWYFRPTRLCTFDPDGTPRDVLDLQLIMASPGFAWNGKTAIIAEKSRLLIIDPAKGTVSGAPLTPQEREDPWWEVHRSPDGREVWVRNTRSATFQKYRWPD